MQIEDLQDIANALPGITYDIKWEHNLCFCITTKIFAMVNVDSIPTTCSFKQSKEGALALLEQEGFRPAPYLGRNHWVQVDDISRLSKQEWKVLLAEAHACIFQKFSKSMRTQLLNEKTT